MATKAPPTETVDVQALLDERTLLLDRVRKLEDGLLMVRTWIDSPDLQPSQTALRRKLDEVKKIVDSVLAQKGG